MDYSPLLCSLRDSLILVFEWKTKPGAERPRRVGCGMAGWRGAGWRGAAMWLTLGPADGSMAACVRRPSSPGTVDTKMMRRSPRSRACCQCQGSDLESCFIDSTSTCSAIPSPVYSLCGCASRLVLPTKHSARFSSNVSSNYRERATLSWLPNG